MDNEELTPAPTPKNKLSFSFDLRFIVAALLVIIVAMIVIWKPWDAVSASDRTITVTGSTKVSAEPDEYVFSPTYQFKNADKDAGLAELTKKSDAVVSELKKLGVADNQIKTDSDGYNYTVYREPDSNNTTYNLSITVTVNNKELAQKVQDFLLTTSPTGAVSPQATFSEGKRKELEAKARDEATKDARAKADQSAKNLGFKVGKVKEVSDGAGFGDIMTLEGRGATTQAENSKAQQLTIQPGENDLTYSVFVVYYVK